MRELTSVGHDGPKWIVLDGDIDPMWIESLNTVMDDNKVRVHLCSLILSYISIFLIMDFVIHPRFWICLHLYISQPKAQTNICTYIFISASHLWLLYVFEQMFKLHKFFLSFVQVLTLASNERISLSSSMRLLFEISHLRAATPATVSRAGILYVNPQDLGWSSYDLHMHTQKHICKIIDFYFFTFLK